jgi:hypothetical protein
MFVVFCIGAVGGIAALMVGVNELEPVSSVIKQKKTEKNCN